MRNRDRRPTQKQNTQPSQSGAYTLDPRCDPPVFWYTRTARGDERFTETTLEFFRTHGINPNNPRMRPESQYITYQVSPYQPWTDQNGSSQIGQCTCKGFSVRKSCRHIIEARELLRISITDNNAKQTQSIESR